MEESRRPHPEACSSLALDLDECRELVQQQEPTAARSARAGVAPPRCGRQPEAARPTPVRLGEGPSSGRADPDDPFRGAASESVVSLGHGGLFSPAGLPWPPVEWRNRSRRHHAGALHPGCRSLRPGRADPELPAASSWRRASSKSAGPGSLEADSTSASEDREESSSTPASEACEIEPPGEEIIEDHYARSRHGTSGPRNAGRRWTWPTDLLRRPQPGRRWTRRGSRGGRHRTGSGTPRDVRPASRGSA